VRLPRWTRLSVQDPQTFDANNFHYLRGRIAENQKRLGTRTRRIRQGGSGKSAALARGMARSRASARLRDQASTERFFGALPKDFPPELKMQIARETGGDFALKNLPGRIDTRGTPGSGRSCKITRVHSESDPRK